MVHVENEVLTHHGQPNESDISSAITQWFMLRMILNMNHCVIAELISLSFLTHHGIEHDVFGLIPHHLENRVHDGDVIQGNMP